jgi:hypothetical protein
VSVVSRQALRRWSVVAAGVAMLCLLPLAIGRWPAGSSSITPERLRDLILGSAALPHQGYAEARADLGLPDLPVIGELTGLASGTTRMRSWYASPQQWRVAVLSTTGESDIYRTVDSTYIWDFERNTLNETSGTPPARLPRATDLLPTDLARRMLRGVGDDPVLALKPRRVAGISAAGLRVLPSDKNTTIGQVDIWADPATGLPLRVEISGHTGPPVLTASFLEVSHEPPAAAVLTPQRPPSASYNWTTGRDVAAAINGVAFVPLPDTLAGQPRYFGPPDQPRIVGLAAYGSGLASFAVAAVPGRTGDRLLAAASDSGGSPIEIDGGEAYELQTPLLSVVVVRGPSIDGLRRRTFLLAGWVTADLLRSAGIEVAARPAGQP